LSETNTTSNLARIVGGKLTLPAVAVAVMLSSCNYLDPNREAITAPYEATRLVLATNEANRLVAQQSSFAPQEKAEVARFFRDSGRIEKEVAQATRITDPNEARASRKRATLARAELYIPERVAFLGAMAALPGAMVPAGSYCRIVERSQAICSDIPMSNPDYIRVRITSGPSKGLQGWGCLGDGIGLTRVMP
jgi:hypothetical protein